MGNFNPMGLSRPITKRYTFPALDKPALTYEQALGHEFRYTFIKPGALEISKALALSEPLSTLYVHGNSTAGAEPSEFPLANDDHEEIYLNDIMIGQACNIAVLMRDKASDGTPCQVYNAEEIIALMLAAPEMYTDLVEFYNNVRAGIADPN